MRIECLTTFLDARERFEPGDTFTVSDERGAQFVAHGWAKKVGDDTPSSVPSEPVTLDIHNVHQTQEVINHG